MKGTVSGARMAPTLAPELKIPVALQGTAFKVILFVQQKADMKITAACSRQFPQIDKPGTQP